MKFMFFIVEERHARNREVYQSHQGILNVAGQKSKPLILWRLLDGNNLLQ